jgi:phage repressor protein C with HTH and peptisase S24 domain
MSTTVVHNTDFRTRLHSIMQQFGSVAELARAAGLSDNAIYKWVSGRGEPSVRSLVALARTAGVSVEWLATGREPTAKGRPETHVAEGGEYISMPRLGIGAVGGRAAIQSAQIVDYATFKTEWVQRRLNAEAKSIALIEAHSDSMSPTVREGDLLLVNLRESSFRHDGIYVLRSGSELAVQRLQRRPDGALAIKSDNPGYDTAVVSPESITVVGKVIWLGGKI